MVNKMYYLPQEIETWYLIPALRKEISLCLISDFKMSYDKVGKILGVSKAAISQYSKGKRAAKIKLPNKLEPILMRSCKRLVAQKSTAVAEIEEMMLIIRNKNLVLSVCDKIKDGVLENCKELRFKDGNYQPVR